MKPKLKLKKGYKVIAITGKDKGKVGEILQVLPLENKVIVAGLNTVTRHTKPSKASSGGIVTKNMPIHISNVAFFDAKTQKASKIGHKFLESGEKVRFAKKSGEVIAEDKKKVK